MDNDKFDIINKQIINDLKKIDKEEELKLKNTNNLKTTKISQKKKPN